jgi:hypothetical protein
MVLISGGFSGAYEQLLPEIQRPTGLAVIGCWQGTGPQSKPCGDALQGGLRADRPRTGSPPEERRPRPSTSRRSVTGSSSAPAWRCGAC